MPAPLIITPTDPILSDPKTVILDATWLYQPEPPRDAYKEFVAGPRFPGARFWSLDDVSEPHPDGYALMLPTPERFAKFAGEHGVERDSHVVVYDGEGIFSAPRTAWTFKVYGHENVSVIDGGLPRAIREGVKLEEGAPTEFKQTTYPVPELVQSVVEFEEAAKLAARSTPVETDTVLIDARPKGAYEAGHIPSSLTLGFPTALLSDDAGKTYLREPKDLEEHLKQELGDEVADKVVKGELKVVNTCGGGLSAAINWLQLQSLGVDSRLYDESWGGYSARPETVRATGPNPL
ncbi:hypothetical protein IAT38_003803 [Cryptococcus sp. DSM 104549]